MRESWVCHGIGRLGGFVSFYPKDDPKDDAAVLLEARAGPLNDVNVDSNSR